MCKGLSLTALADDQRKAKEAALNELEAYIYKVKNRIMDDEDKLKAVSTEEQRQEVVDLANNAEEWLYDEGRDQKVEVYQEKQKEIRVKAEAIFHRYSELTARPEAMKKARSSLAEVKNIVSTWAEKMPHITQEEKDKLLDTVSKAEAWLEEKDELQAAKSPFEDPVFDSADVPLQLRTAGMLLDRLMKKPKPAPPAPEKVLYID